MVYIELLAKENLKVKNYLIENPLPWQPPSTLRNPCTPHNPSRHAFMTRGPPGKGQILRDPLNLSPSILEHIPISPILFIPISITSHCEYNVDYVTPKEMLNPTGHFMTTTVKDTRTYSIYQENRLRCRR